MCSKVGQIKPFFSSHCQLKNCTTYKLRIIFYLVDFLRPEAQETASQIALRVCSIEVRGGGARI